MNALLSVMNQKLLLVLLLIAAMVGTSLAQGYKPPKGKSKSSKTKSKSKIKTFDPLAPISTTTGDSDAPRGSEDGPVAKPIRKTKIEHPVLVFYQQAPPGKVAQQLVMDEEDLVMLRYLTPDQLLTRRDVYVDGLSNLALPGSDVTKYRLLGTSGLADAERLPAGDGQSFYSKMKVPSPGFLYVVEESAEEYRHFVKGSQKQGAMLDFQVNGLPGLDSVRAVYTLRRMDSAERGAGTGATVR